MHEIHLDPRPYGDTAMEALTVTLAGATAYALAGARVESLFLFHGPRGPFWHASATINAPCDPTDWEPLGWPKSAATGYAPRVLHRRPQGSGYFHSMDPARIRLESYPSFAEGLDTETQVMMTGLSLSLVASGPLQALIGSSNGEDFLGKEKLPRSEWLEELYASLDRLTDAADPKRTPIENLHAGITRELARMDLRLLPACTDHPGEPALEAAKALLRDLTMVGALLPGQPTLVDLQRYREQAPARYAAILASPGLCNRDWAFLVEHPPGASAWFDFLLGSCKADGQKAMLFLYAGFLAFLEQVVILRAFERMGDDFLREDTPAPIHETRAAWRGFRHGRFTWVAT